MRSLGSISSELCEMQRLRDSNIALRLKDAEWQRRIMMPPPSPPPQPQPPPPPASLLSVPPRRSPTTAPLNPAHLPPTFVRDPRLFAPPPPKPNLSASPPVSAHFSAPHPPSLASASPPNPAPHSLIFDPQLPISNSYQHQHQQQPQQQPQQQQPHQPPPPPVLPSSSPAQSVLSTSTNAHSSDASISLKPNHPARKPRSHARGVGKIRRHRMTKEEEARFDPRDLVDLKGSTAAKSRKMTPQERDIMLHKRRLRNRQSAARSRDKQRKTITELGDEVDQLLLKAQRVKQRCHSAEQQLRDLRAAHEALRTENEQLKLSNNQLKIANNELRQNQPTQALTHAPNIPRTGSTLRVSLSTDMLDKIIGASSNAEGLLPGGAESSGMLRIPSKLHLSLSTDRLSEGLTPAGNSSQATMGRNMSIVERLFDLANNGSNANNISFDNILINTDIEVKKE